MKILKSFSFCIFFLFLNSCSLSGSIKSNASATPNPVVSPVTGTDDLRFDTPTEYINISNQTSYALTGICNTENKISIYINEVIYTDQVSCSNGLFTAEVNFSAFSSGELNIKAITTTSSSTSEATTTVTILKDIISPTLSGSLNDGTTSSSLIQSPALSWSAASDEHSGVAQYQVAVGSSLGGTQILGWTGIGNVLTYQVGSLSLTNGQTYYASVRAVDAAGNISSAINGDGWSVSISAGGGGSGVTSHGLNYSKMASEGFTPAARGASFDLQFGQSVAISEDGLTMAIGHPYDSTDANGVLNSQWTRSGSVYIYEYSGGNWVFEEKIVLSNSQSNLYRNDNFGVHVALSGNTLAVGASGHNLDENNLNIDGFDSSGAIFIYVKSSGVWNFQQKLVDPQRNDYKLFGEVFDLDDNTLVVGLPRDNLDENGLNDLYQAGSAFIYFRSGSVWTLEKHIIPSGTNARNSEDNFGFSVAVDQDTVIIGSPYHNFDAAGASSLSDAGAAFIYKRTTGVWNLEEKIVASGTNGRRSFDTLGYSVDLFGDVAAVGAPDQDFDSSGANSVPSAGAVYIFERVSNDWSQVTKLVGTVSANSRVIGDIFGYTVRLSNTTLVVSVPYQDYDSSGGNFLEATGAIYVYVYTTSWNLEQKITPTGTNSRLSDNYFSNADQFSKAIALVGEKLISTAPGQDFDSNGNNKIFNAGAVFSFERSTGVWSQTQKVVDTVAPSFRSNLFASSNSYFDSEVDISADGMTLAIGSPSEHYDKDNLNPEYRSGAVYIYKKISGVWQFSNMITPTGVNARNQEDYFGASISLNANYLAVGAPYHGYDSSGANYSAWSGAVFIYEWDGTTWDQVQKITATGVNSRHGENFGSSLKFDGSLLAVGASGDSYNSVGASYVQLAGAVFMYNLSGGTWVLDEKIVATGVNARRMDNYFGKTIDLNNGTMIVGVSDHDYDENGDNNSDYAGAVFVYTDQSGTWTLQQKLVGVGVNGRVDYDNFGESVSIDGDTIVVSSYNYYTDTGADANSSSIFIFDRTASTWSLTQKINGESMPNFTNFDGFGSRGVSISGNYIAVGAPSNTTDENGLNTLSSAGAIYVLKKTAGVWGYETKIVANGTNARNVDDSFGKFVKIVEHGANSFTVSGASNNAYDTSGSNPVVGSGSAFVFSK